MTEKKHDEDPLPRKGEPASDRERERPQPAEEWGSGIEQGRAIHRGGKDTGHVPGANEEKQ